MKCLQIINQESLINKFVTEYDFNHQHGSIPLQNNFCWIFGHIGKLKLFWSLGWPRRLWSSRKHEGKRMFLLHHSRKWLWIQAFLDFLSFDFCDFRFNAVYNSILFCSPSILLSNLDLCDLRPPLFSMCPHINSVNRGMPV